MHSTVLIATFAGLLCLQTVGSAQSRPPESLCGPEIATIGDAWEAARIELIEMQRLLDDGDLVRWPQRMAALVSHARFIERRGASPNTETWKKVRQAVRIVTERQSLTNHFALGNEAARLREELEQLRSGVQLIGQNFTPQDLTPITRLDHLYPSVPSTLSLKVQSAAVFTAGAEHVVTFELRNLSGAIVDESQLIPVHGAILHLFAIDRSGNDFHHSVASAIGQDGRFMAAF